MVAAQSLNFNPVPTALVGFDFLICFTLQTPSKTEVSLGCSPLVGLCDSVVSNPKSDALDCEKYKRQKEMKDG